MKDCNNCKVRKAIAKAFDLHWHDEEDCPFECKEPDVDKKEEKDKKDV